MSGGTDQKTELPVSIGKPAMRALNNAGIDHLEQLTDYTESEIIRLHGMGPRAVDRLRASLARQGMAFRYTSGSG